MANNYEKYFRSTGDVDLDILKINIKKITEGFFSYLEEKNNIKREFYKRNPHVWDDNIKGKDFPYITIGKYVLSFNHWRNSSDLYLLLSNGTIDISEHPFLQLSLGRILFDEGMATWCISAESKLIENYCNKNFKQIGDKEDKLLKRVKYQEELLGRKRFTYKSYLLQRKNKEDIFPLLDEIIREAIKEFSSKNCNNVSIETKTLKNSINNKIKAEKLLKDVSVIEGGLQETKLNRRNRKRNKNLIDQVMERDNYSCQACGLKLEHNGKYVLNIHHKVPLSSTEGEVETDESKLICLCPTCHYIAHLSDNKKIPYDAKKIRKIREDADK